LKELEEPPANTTIMLITHQPSRLLPTIRSRCRELRCATLGTDDLTAALQQAGIDATNAEGLATLAGGSAGDAVRLLRHDGLQLYGELIHMFDGLPNVNRTAVLRLAENCAARGADTRYGLTLDLIDQFIARAARTGLFGVPSMQAAPNEARLLARLSPNDHAARTWAQLQQDLTGRVRHGRAVNLDPASLILDMIFKIEHVARSVAAK
jgi:DNA polymerase-3 subunit delta'